MILNLTLMGPHLSSKPTFHHTVWIALKNHMLCERTRRVTGKMFRPKSYAAHRVRP